MNTLFLIIFYTWMAAIVFLIGSRIWLAYERRRLREAEEQLKELGP